MQDCGSTSSSSSSQHRLPRPRRGITDGILVSQAAEELGLEFSFFTAELSASAPVDGRLGSLVRYVLRSASRGRHETGNVLSNVGFHSGCQDLTQCNIGIRHSWIVRTEYLNMWFLQKDMKHRDVL